VLVKQSLQLKVSQSLAMTPQLQQAIKLLQLSSLELQAEIQEALEANPLLEIEEENKETKEEIESNNADLKEKALEKEKEVDNNSQFDEIPDDLPVDSSWENEYEPIQTSSAQHEDRADFTEYTSSGDITLQDHLLEQILLKKETKVDKHAALIIIDAIDDNGHLTEPKDALLLTIQKEYPEFDLDDFNCVFTMLHNLDPIGIACTGPAESMCVQLEHLPKNTPHVESALNLLNNHLEFLANRDYARIKKAMKINDEILQNILKLIQTLNPKPGNIIDSGNTEYIVPDVYIKKHQDHWRVELNSESAPRISINQYYANLIKSNKGKESSTFLKGHMQEAKWFIKSLQSRNDTLLKVAISIVEKQQSFMNYGEVKMKPLILKEIADELGFHESTISRVTNKKYMHTPRGIFEFKYFFSSHVSTQSGQECSATAIRAMIKNLVDAENTKKPLSDNKMANILSEEGINVARRTIAKYRESINIPPSNERKHI
jgi:RNA polymerase sigma-54 factor